MGDWFLHPRRRHLADALVLAWVLVCAVAGYTAGRALDNVSEVTRAIRRSTELGPWPGPRGAVDSL